MQATGRDITNGVAAVVGAFMSWEDALTGVRRTTNLSDADFDILGQGIRDLSMIIPTTAVDLADIATIAGQMGIDGVENILIFTETIAKIGDVTDLTHEQAAFDMARIAEIMGMPIDNVDNLGAAIVDLGNNYATTEPLITSAAMRASGAAATLGISEQALIGAAGAITTVVPRAQSAGSTLARIWTEMASAVFEGGPKLEAFAHTLGLTADETANLIQSNPEEAFIGFIEGMDKSVQNGENWIALLDDMDLNTIRTREGILNLASTHDLLRDTIDTSNTAFEENTALNIEAERRYATLSNQIQLFKNILTDITVTMGETLAPVIADIIGKLEPFVRIIKQFAEDHPELVRSLLLITFGLGAMLMAVGSLTVAVAVLSVMGPFLTAAFAPWMVILLALIVAIALLVIFWPQISGFFQDMIDKVLWLTDIIVPWVTQWYDLISSLEIVQFVVERAILKFDALLDMILSLKDLFLNIISFIVNIWQGDWDAAWDDIKDIAIGAVDILFAYFRLGWLPDVIAFFQQFGPRILIAMSHLPALLLTFGGSALQALWDGFIEYWDDVVYWYFIGWPRLILESLWELQGLLWPGGRDLQMSLLDGFVWMWNNVVKPALQALPGLIIGAIGSLARTLWEAGKALLHGLWDGMSWLWYEAFQPALQAFPGLVIGALGFTLGTLFGAGKLLVRGLWDGAIHVAWQMLEWAILLGGALADTFISAFKSIWNAGADAINSLIPGSIDVPGIAIPFSPDIPGFSVPMPLGGNPIPRLGDGGLALRETLAVVGDVPELIIPLDKLEGMGGITLVQHFHGPADPNQVEDAATRGLQRGLRQRGRVL